MTPLLPPPFRLVDLGTVTSTNDVALAMARDGAAAWTVVRARVQTRGRGRGGRSFSSPDGNSYVSLILRPSCPPAALPGLGLVAGLAVADAIRTFAPRIPPVRCKWPNDVLVGGAKVAGILVESRIGAALEAVVAGIGINLVSHPAIDGLRATSLAAEGAPSTDRDELLTVLADCLEARIRTWENGGFQALRQSWLEGAAGVGEPATLIGERPVTGLFAGVAGDGALLLESGGALRRFVSGSLVLEGRP